MFPNYFAARGRCAMHHDSLKLRISIEQSLRILEIIGFRVEAVNLVSLARECIGKSEYKRGSSMTKAPQQFDCSSFMKWLYAQRGIWLPRRSIQQREFGRRVNLPDIVSGDLVFTSGRINYFHDDPDDGVGHVGMATDQGTVIHAANRSSGIAETEITRFIENSFRGARRIIPENVDVLTLSIPVNREVEISEDLRWIILQNLNLLNP